MDKNGPSHLHAAAERMEQERGDERQLNPYLIEGWEERQKGWFEVIAAKVIRREGEWESTVSEVFGFVVQTYDERPDGYGT